MRIGNIIIKRHKHDWVKLVIECWESRGKPGWMLKVGEKCLNKDCDYGGYRNVISIFLREKPNVLEIE